MTRLGRTIRALILFSVLLGVLFLAQVYGAVPTEVFAIVSVGWVLFVVDLAMSFVRPRLSYYFAFVLAILALSSSLPETAHYAFIQAGEVLPSATFVLGSAAQVLLVILVPYFAWKSRKEATT